MLLASADPGPSFDIVRPRGAAGALVFASPHSGSAAPEDFGHAPGLSETRLRSAEDALVDRLIRSGADRGAPILTGRISRAYVDLNRAPDELDPALIDDCPEAGPLSAKTAAGFGVIPRRAGDGTALYDRRLSLAEAARRIAGVHAPYHAALATLMEEARGRHGQAVLVDWHSMPSAPARGRRRSPSEVAVVLGDRHGTACDPAVTRRMRTLFEAAGWRVVLNTPYAGGYSTQRWGRPGEGFHAVQVELSRGLYLDQTTRRPGPGFEACQAVLTQVIAALADDCGL